MTLDTPLESAKSAVRAGFSSLGLSELLIDTQSIIFEKPAHSTHGDWACTAPLTFFTAVQNAGSALPSPRALAEQIVAVAQPLLENEAWFEQMSVAGPGFINITFSDEFYIAKMLEMAKTQARVPHIKKAGKTAIVEYSSPNIAKPFTIGHLRSTIIGQAVANLLEAVGYTVLRDNHLGDWGTQFGKQMYAIQNLGAGSEEANIAKIEHSENPVAELVQLYVEFHQKAEQDPMLGEKGREWFAKLENGDPKARELWQKCIDWSFVEFAKIYKRLGVEFYDGFAGGRGLGESFFEDKMGVVLEELKQKLTPQGLYQESKGAQLVFFPDDELPPLMIIKQDGSTLYATRDLATDYYRKQEFGDDLLVVNEVGAEQSLYFKQLYRTEELLGWYKPGQRVHVAHGLYSFKDKKMSTRKGNVIWLSEVLDEAEKRAAVLGEEAGHAEKSGQRGEAEQVEESEQVKEAGQIAQKTENAQQSQTERTISNKQSYAAQRHAGNVAVRDSNAQIIGLGALKWNDLKRSAHLNVTFDWDEILNMQGNSGPYLQYSFVRTHSILDKAESNFAISIDTVLSSLSYDSKSLVADEKKILRLLAEYFDIVHLAATSFAPHHLCTYLHELAQAFNSFYNTQQVLEEVDGKLTQKAHFRLALTATVGMVLQNGLEIIGIQTVDRM
jgi:arginyl-tRNA synthetase